MRLSFLICVGLLLAAKAQAQHGHDNHDTHNATVRHSFDDPEKWSAVFDDSARAAWQKPEDVAQALHLQPGQVLLDIGAGTGYFNATFARLVSPGGRIYAADVEASLVDWMLKRAVREGTPEVFPLLIPTDDPRVPERVDVAFVCDTWHHIDDRIGYAGKLRAILKPGGSVVVVDFRKGEIPVGPPEEHRLDPEKVIEEMEGGGLKLTRREDFLPYQYILIFQSK